MMLFPEFIVPFLLIGAFSKINFDELFELPVDCEVVSGLEVVAYSARIVIFGKIFCAGKAKDMSALSKHRFQEGLKAYGALESGLIEQFFYSIKRWSFHL